MNRRSVRPARAVPRRAIPGRAIPLLLTLGTATVAAQAAAAADPREPAIEAAIVEHVEAHTADSLALVERAVAINSGTLNFSGVREVGALFAAELETLGFSVRWIDGSAWGRAGHLVAERPGGGPRVLLIGHLDTVFEADSPFQTSERLDDRRLRGPGTTDMKGGNAVMIYALKALAAAGVLDRLELAVVLTGDEEKAGRPLERSRAALREAARDADVALGFEDGDGNAATAVISRRGSTSWRLAVTGVPAHSSQVFQPEVGAGAIYELARILTRFYEELTSEVDLTFNPGVVVGGTEVAFDSGEGRGTAFGKNNVVAGDARAAGDLRALTPEQYARAKEKMLEIAADSLPQTAATLTFSEGYPPLAPTAGNRELLELYDRVSRDLGHGPVEAVNPRNAGAADVSFVADLVPRVLDGLGLMGTGGHTVEETADLETLPSQTARAAVLLYRLSLEPTR